MFHLNKLLKLFHYCGIKMNKTNRLISYCKNNHLECRLMINVPLFTQCCHTVDSFFTHTNTRFDLKISVLDGKSDFMECLLQRKLPIWHCHSYILYLFFIAMDSYKHRNFVDEPMAEKDVQELPGVGAESRTRLVLEYLE